MKLVVLDGYTTTRDGLEWNNLKKYGELETYDWTTPEELMGRAKDADALFTNKVKLGREAFSALPKLKYIGLLCTGKDSVDTEAADEFGIKVTNVPAYAEHSVPQLAFALILELCYGIRDHVDYVMADKKWSSHGYNTYWLKPLIGLEGKKLGVVGMGSIGRNVARIGQAFGMKVIAYDVIRSNLPDVEWASVEEVIRSSDFLSLNCHLTKDTEKMINQRTLAMMKPTAYLINTSRGGLVDEAALIDALNNGVIAGAGLDVIELEPPRADDPLFETKNLIITPHIGWATLEARQKIIKIVEDNFSEFYNDYRLGEAGKK